MKELSVTDAMVQRGSVREFEDAPVAADIVREILALAVNAPSGGNLQPWKVYAVAGAVKAALCASVAERAVESPGGTDPLQ